MIYILYLWLAGSTYTYPINTQEYSSKQACLAARAAVISAMQEEAMRKPRGICINKATGDAAK